ncbi:hypothetical protein B0H14DRAFT_2821009, partial [Mycena olivaceomarginata]
MRAAHGPSRSIPAAAAAAVLAYAYSITAWPRDSVALGAAYVIRARPAPWPRPPGCRRRVSALLSLNSSSLQPLRSLARSWLKLRLQPESSSYSVRLQLRGTSQGTITPRLIIRLAVPLGSGVGHYHILNWKLNANFKLQSKQASCPSCASRSLPRAWPR